MQAPASLLPGVLSAVHEDRYATVETALGPVFVAFNANGISAARREKGRAHFERWFANEFGRRATPAERVPESLLRSKKFDLGALTPFEAAVLRKALEIPAGEVRTYSWVAREIGHPAAVRAVGSALANNPIPYLIPCHRVVRTDGTIGQYGGGGPAAKRALLSAEGAEPERLEQLARGGIRYEGSDSTRIFCFPTCRNARRITPEHRVGFASEREALASGFRPCRVCRPAAMAS